VRVRVIGRRREREERADEAVTAVVKRLNMMTCTVQG
jgi:hypothetical protein